MIKLAGNADVVSSIREQSASDIDMRALPVLPGGKSTSMLALLLGSVRAARRESRMGPDQYNASSIGERRVEVSVPSTEGEAASVWDLLGV